jgi:hypothetical protein
MDETEDALAGFGEMIRRSMEAAKRLPADVIAADARERMPDDDFDGALWAALCGRVDAGDDPSEWPSSVRAYYATRMIDWEVANGGFRQAMHNVPELFQAAVAGYELLGRTDLAEVLRSALAAPDLDALDALDVQLGENDQERIVYVREHTTEFRL